MPPADLSGRGHKKLTHTLHMLHFFLCTCIIQVQARDLADCNKYNKLNVLLMHKIITHCQLKPDIGKHLFGCSLHLYDARLINYRTIKHLVKVWRTWPLGRDWGENQRFSLLYLMVGVQVQHNLTSFQGWLCVIAPTLLGLLHSWRVCGDKSCQSCEYVDVLMGRWFRISPLHN